MRPPKSGASGGQSGGGGLDDYAAWLRAGGCSPATIRLRTVHLRCYAKEHDLWNATPADIVAWLEQPGWKPATRASVRASLMSFYKWAIGEGLVDQDPTVRTRPVRLPESPVREAPRDAVDAAIAQASGRDRLALCLAAYAGLRRGEIAGLHSEDIDLVNDMLEVRGKGGKTRRVPVVPKLREELIAAKIRGGYVFPGVNGEGSISPDSLGHRLARLIPGKWTVHSLRHSFASSVYRASKDIRAVQQLLGHASLETTQVYTRVDEDDLRAAVGMWSS